MQKVGDEKDFLDILELRITLRCNLSCRYCFLGGSLYQADKEIMSLEDYKWLIRTCKNNGLSEVVFTGGEPFVRFGLLRELVEYSSSLHLQTKIHSNGTLISSERCRQLVDAGLTEIRISIDTVDEVLFEKITESRGLYKKLDDNIGHLARCAGLVVGGRFTITGVNHQYIAQVYNYCAERGLDYLELKPVAIVGSASEHPELSLSKEQHVAVMREALELEKTKRIELRFDSPCFHFLVADTTVPHYSCSCASRRLSVSPSGDVTPCVYLGLEEVSIGNIYEDDIQDLYHSEFSTRMRLTIPEECQRCPDYQICKGGCKARIFNAYKRFDRVPPECLLLKS
jgi:radical SAM protein with 4Fe4S-binding SPASM domain